MKRLAFLFLLAFSGCGPFYPVIDAEYLENFNRDQSERELFAGHRKAYRGLGLDRWKFQKD